MKNAAHGSAEGKRRATTEKRRVKDMINKFKRNDPSADAAALQTALQDVTAPQKRAGSGVVALYTGSGFSAATDNTNSDNVSDLSEERLRKLDAYDKKRMSARN